MKPIALKDLPGVWTDRLTALAWQLEHKEDMIARKAWHEAELRGWPDERSLLCAREWARGAMVEALYGAFYTVHGRFPKDPEEAAALSDFGAELRAKVKPAMAGGRT